MNRVRFTVSLAVAVMSALLVAGTASAQMNKCVDGAGRTTYSDKPCPGGKSAAPMSSPAPAPAKPAPRATAVPQPTGEIVSAPQGHPPLPNVAAKECAERWPFTWAHIRPDRARAETARIQSDRQRAKELEAQTTADFLRPCARHGFVSPADDRLVQQNDQLAERIKKKFAADYERRVVWDAEQQAKLPPRSPSLATLSPAAPAPARVAGSLSRAEANEMHQCVEDWENEAHARKTAGIGFQGRKPDATYIKFQATRRQNVMARFMGRCMRFGFEDAHDEAGERRNDQLAERLKSKVDAAREAEQATLMREQLKSDSDDRAAQTAREQQALRSSCQRERKALDEARAELAKLPSHQRDAYRGTVDKAEREWHSTCAK